MKTKNNVQKAILRTGAVIVSFVLISLTVSAQDFWKKLLTNSSFNEIAVAMIETETASLPGKSDAETSADFNFEAVYEPALKLENWMTSEYYFSYFNFLQESENELPLQLEEWMLNEGNFSTPADKDNLLELENWMVNNAHWNI